MNIERHNYRCVPYITSNVPGGAWAHVMTPGVCETFLKVHGWFHYVEIGVR